MKPATRQKAAAIIEKIENAVKGGPGSGPRPGGGVGTKPEGVFKTGDLVHIPSVGNGRVISTQFTHRGPKVEVDLGGGVSKVESPDNIRHGHHPSLRGGS